MRSLEELLDEYEAAHQNPLNQTIHMICIPVIVASTIGLGWLVGLPGELGLVVNLGTLGVIATLAFYSRFGARPLAGTALMFGGSLAFVAVIDASPLPLWAVAGGLWIAAWAAQLVGHQAEGVKPSFTDDLVFFLIGPLFFLEEIGFPVRERGSVAA